LGYACEIPAMGFDPWRPKMAIPKEWTKITKQEYEMFRMNALYQEKKNNLCRM
jgi:hypothetical protein